MTAELTRDEIEHMAADIHASHPWHKAITKLLAQLDAANARADAAAERMRDAMLAVKPHVPLAMGASYLAGFRDALAFYSKAIDALPLHEEPNNDAG